MDRKKRTDRNHVIYRLTCGDTNQTYIGLTVMRGRAVIKTINTRFQQHCYRAENQDKAWALCDAIRKYDNWFVEAVEIVRGKKEAHARERQLIAELEPELNTQ